jgi:hypothetical protein
MRFRAASALAIGLAFQLTSGATFAHHSFAAEFDNTISVTLYGVTTSVEIVNPHSFIYIDVKSEGAVERWALEGPAPQQVRRMERDHDFLTPGAELGACGYLARRDVVPTRKEPVTAKAARRLLAAVLITPTRGKFIWVNYRQGKCGLDAETLGSRRSGKKSTHAGRPFVLPFAV